MNMQFGKLIDCKSVQLLNAVLAIYSHDVKSIYFSHLHFWNAKLSTVIHLGKLTETNAVL